MGDKVLVVADHSSPALLGSSLYSAICNIIQRNVVFRGGKPTIATIAAIRRCKGKIQEYKRQEIEDNGKNNKWYYQVLRSWLLWRH